MEKLYFITQPGFEEELCKEIAEAWPFLLDSKACRHTFALPEFTLHHGGVEFSADLFVAVQLNFFVRTGSRLLWRVAQFNVRDFPKLFQKLSSLRLEKYISLANYRVKATASESKLGQEKRIVETAEKAFKITSSNVSEDKNIFIRIYQNECTVSIDTSGEHLHVRGILRNRGEAPLRETIAAFCLRKLRLNTSLAEIAKVNLVDPFCGSGTFLIEASLMHQALFHRNYTFKDFRQLPQLFRQEKFQFNYKLPEVIQYQSYLGLDMNDKVLLAAQKNAAELKVSTPPVEISLQNENLFETAKRHLKKPLWIIANPPYGERLSLEKPQLLYNRIFEKYNPERVGVLWSQEIAQRLTLPEGYAKVATYKVSNGGLDCAFVIASRTASVDF
jgi:putative N6-adenine-specific DNA methylase